MKPKKLVVDWSDPDQIAAMVMVMMGCYHAKTIMKHTGLRLPQLRHRMDKRGILFRDTRSFKSKSAELMMELAYKEIELLFKSSS